MQDVQGMVIKMIIREIMNELQQGDGYTEGCWDSEGETQRDAARTKATEVRNRPKWRPNRLMAGMRMFVLSYSRI